MHPGSSYSYQFRIHVHISKRDTSDNAVIAVNVYQKDGDSLTCNHPGQLLFGPFPKGLAPLRGVDLCQSDPGFAGLRIQYVDGIPVNNLDNGAIQIPLFRVVLGAMLSRAGGRKEQKNDQNDSHRAILPMDGLQAEEKATPEGGL